MHSSFALGIKHPSGVGTEAFAMKDKIPVKIRLEQTLYDFGFAGLIGTFHLSSTVTSPLPLCRKWNETSQDLRGSAFCRSC